MRLEAIVPIVILAAGIAQAAQLAPAVPANSDAVPFFAKNGGCPPFLADPPVVVSSRRIALNS